MKSTLASCAALAVFLVAAPSWAQSLTPITGWVPFDSPKAKVLLQGNSTKPAHAVTHDAAGH
jgi:hypothetical protein